MESQSETISPLDAARLANVTDRAVRLWCEQVPGLAQRDQIGRWRIDAAAFLDFLDERVRRAERITVEARRQISTGALIKKPRSRKLIAPATERFSGTILLRMPLKMRDAVEHAAGGRGGMAAFVREAISAHLATKGAAAPHGPLPHDPARPQA
jgi:hypothetical protein